MISMCDIFAIVTDRFIHCLFFFFNDPATTEIYTYCHTLPLHDAPPIFTGVGFVNSLTQVAVTALLVVYASERLGISTSSPMIGAVWTAVSVGGVVGAVLLPRLPAQWPVGAITVGALTIGPVVLFVVATTGNTGAAITALVVYSGCATATILIGVGARQRLTPARRQGRVNTTARKDPGGGSPVGP